MNLSEPERKLVEEMRGFGVLADADGHRLDQREGIIMVTCADGDQMPDIFRFQAKLSEGQRTDPRIHTLSLNGGALLLPEDTKLIVRRGRRFREDVVLMEHIRVARNLKQIDTIALYAHAPCGMARLMHLSFEDVIATLIAAKARIKGDNHGAKVACFCHVDRGNGRKRTYFVSRDRWDAWKAGHAEDNSAK